MQGRSPVEKIVADIEAWVFFHLGADAELTIDTTPEGLLVRFSHARVRPSRIAFSQADLTAFAASAELLESRLLEELARLRRSE